MPFSYQFASNERYREYLQSPEWREMRQAVKKRCNGICERCGKFLMDQVHHLTYERVFNERLEDLQGMCIPCHKFLHGKNEIDPLVPSIRVKVSWKIIEWQDSKAMKCRRVRISTLPSERFQWFKTCAANGKAVDISLAHCQLGLFQVPVEVFLDEQGEPVLHPSRWEKYRTGIRLTQYWYSHTPTGRPIPPSPEEIRTEIKSQEARKREEIARMQERPECYRSFQGRSPQAANEVIALFKAARRIITHGDECEIRNVRRTRTRGIVLDLQYEKTDGTVIRFKIHDAEKLLANGELLFDSERSQFVVADQMPRQLS